MLQISNNIKQVKKSVASWAREKEKDHQKADSSHAHTKVKTATWFIEKIQHIRQQVNDILRKCNSKYKQRHDQHWVPHKFQVDDKVWLHL